MAKITKEEFEKLPDSVKEIFVEHEDGYISQTEADAALKAKNAELLEEIKKQKKLFEKFDGIDPEKAKQALDELKKLEDKKLADKGKYEELLENYKAEYEKKLEAERREKEQFLSNLKREKLTNFLIEKGVLPDRAKFALAETLDLVELELGESGIKLKKAGGIGDAKELDSLIEEMKTSSAFLFKSESASGSGASGSNSNGGAADWENLSPEEKLNLANAQGAGKT